MTEFVVAGLGNPGERYRRTRHNLGFRVVEGIAAGRRGAWSPAARKRRTARVRMAGARILLLEPLTYMNLSGDAILPLVLEENLPPQRLLVVCDDIALPLGQMRLRGSGSDGGHNGLGSVIERLGTGDFPRLRLGVGPVPARVDPAEFVLAEFLPEEEPAVDGMIEAALACVEAWVAEGIERAMTRFNVRREPPGPEPGGG